MGAPPSITGVRVAQLDGLRALAVVAVMFAHAAPAAGAGGTLGVDVFFVLSGFLITGVLLGEHRATGRISLRRFYRRRLLRLYPALLALIVVCTPIGVRLTPDHTWTSWFESAAAAATYTANLAMLFDGSLFMGVLDPTWSLAIEEQFYLLWPLALLGLLALRLPLRWTVAVVLAFAAAGLSLFWLLFDPPTTVQPPLSIAGIEAALRPDARFGELLLGCALALGLSRRGERFSAREDWAISALALLAVGGLVLARAQFAHAAETAGNPLAMAPVVAVCTALIVARLATSDRALLSRTLRLTPLPQIGLISYGLYLWHVPVYTAVREDPLGLRGFEQPVQWALTFLAAFLSYRFVETPFLRRKARLRSTPVAGLEPEGLEHLPPEAPRATAPV